MALLQQSPQSARRLCLTTVVLLVQTTVSEQSGAAEAVRRVRTKVGADSSWRADFIEEGPDDYPAGVRRSELHSDRSDHQVEHGVQQQAHFVITSDLIADMEYRRNRERRYVLTKLVGQHMNNSTIWLLSWTVGYVLCCFMSLLSALGYVLQKYAHVLMMRKDPDNVGCYFLHPWWVIGFSVWLFAELVNVLATALAPLTLLRFSKAWPITCLVAISRLILGEEVSFKAFAVITGLLFGSGLIASYAPVVATPEITFERPGLQIATMTSRFISAGVVCGLLAFTSLVTTTAVSKCPTCRGSASSQPWKWKYTPFFWACFAAFCAGCTQTLFKCIVVLTMAAPGETFPTYPASYALLISVLLCGVVEVHTLNLGLRHGDSVLLLPMYFCLSTVSQVFLCGIVFGELGQFSSASNAGMFCIGVGILLGCVWLLARMPASMATWQMRELA